MVSLEFFH